MPKEWLTIHDRLAAREITVQEAERLTRKIKAPQWLKEDMLIYLALANSGYN